MTILFKFESIIVIIFVELKIQFWGLGIEPSLHSSRLQCIEFETGWVLSDGDECVI